MIIMTPEKLKKGNLVKVISPSISMALPWITEDIKKQATKKFEGMGLEVSHGKHVMEKNKYNSSSIKSRVDDIHEAFRDPEVKMIITIMGGYNSIEILPHLDYDLIKSNPKILCGYSDITALANAIYAKTGLVTYSGPHFFDFGEQKGFDYTLDYFKKCLIFEKIYEIKPSEKWSNDRWGKNQKNRKFEKNEGIRVINRGECEGTIVGGNLITLHSIAVTPYMPSLKDKVLFIEEDKEESVYTFIRNLTSLTYRLDFSGVKGIVIGRFQPESNINDEDIKFLVNNNLALQKIPIIAGVDFGHTTPKITFPIGGNVRVNAKNDNAKIEIIKH